MHASPRIHPLEFTSAWLSSMYPVDLAGLPLTGLNWSMRLVPWLDGRPRTLNLAIQGRVFPGLAWPRPPVITVFSFPPFFSVAPSRWDSYCRLSWGHQAARFPLWEHWTSRLLALGASSHSFSPEYLLRTLPKPNFSFYAVSSIS